VSCPREPEVWREVGLLSRRRIQPVSATSGITSLGLLRSARKLLGS
jgi:hypothetical protein